MLTVCMPGAGPEPSMVDTAPEGKAPTVAPDVDSTAPDGTAETPGVDSTAPEGTAPTVAPGVDGTAPTVTVDTAWVAGWLQR